MRLRGRVDAILVAVALLPIATAAHAQSVAVRWNQVALQAVALNPPAPTATTWRLHVLSTAMYDAWSAYHPHAIGFVTGTELKRPTSEHTLANREQAVSFAAFRILHRTFPKQRSLFRRTLQELGYERPFHRGSLGDPGGVGDQTARRVLRWCVGDQTNFQQGFAQIVSETYPVLYEPVNAADPEAANAPGGASFDPNRWQPLRVPNGSLRDEHGNPIFDNGDPSTYTDQSFLTPHWGAARGFALTSGDQFRPPGPPIAGSTEPYVDALGETMTHDEAWNLQLDEVLEINTTLRDREKVIAEFWADGPRTWTPPGHWNQIAQGLSIRDRNSLADDVKMFFALNGALYDAGIVAWEAKREFDFIRPISAIRHKYYGVEIDAWAGPDRGTQRIPGEQWLPYQELGFVTPGFPEFVSGHSTFSRAAREVLRAFTGSDRFYDGKTVLDADYDGDGKLDLLGQHVALPGSLRIESTVPRAPVVLRWRTLLEAAEEAGVSRLYGGIHFMDGNLRGQELGRHVGRQAWRHARQYWRGQAPAQQVGVSTASDTGSAIGAGPQPRFAGAASPSGPGAAAARPTARGPAR